MTVEDLMKKLKELCDLDFGYKMIEVRNRAGDYGYIDEIVEHEDTVYLDS